MKSKMKLLSAILLVSALALAGCLVSGVVVVDQMIYHIEFTTEHDFYVYDIDLTEEDGWEDVSDKLERIEALGFELWVSNDNLTPATFNVWLDDLDDPRETTVGGVEANATNVLSDLTLQNGENYFSYAETISHIHNVNTLRDLLLTGMFRFYGTSSAGNAVSDYAIDSMRVIVAVSAGTT